MDGLSVNLILVLLIVQSVTIDAMNMTFPDSMEEDLTMDKLMTIVNVKDTEEVLSMLGMKDSTLLTKIEDHEINYAEQAVCEPELKAIKIDKGDIEVGEILFPPSVRVLRCGGCCDLSNRMACTPTKISFRDVVRAKILMKGLTRSASSQTIPIEVHEECRCMCKIKEENCDLTLHNYSSKQCKCTCKNEKEFLSCRNEAATKKWDFKECVCKCRKEQHCPTGTVFRHTDCSCEAE